MSRQTLGQRPAPGERRVELGAQHGSPRCVVRRNLEAEGSGFLANGGACSGEKPGPALQRLKLGEQEGPAPVLLVGGVDASSHAGDGIRVRRFASLHRTREADVFLRRRVEGRSAGHRARGESPETYKDNQRAHGR